MKAVIMMLLLTTTMVNAQQSPLPTAMTIKSVNWLTGNWERTNCRPGIKAHEKWTSGRPDELRGIGVTMNRKDTVFLEKIRIVHEGGSLFYIADVKENENPVSFKFTAVSSSGFVCENPAHDFPKKIEYILNGTNLTVIISGNGKSQTFTFEKT